MNASGFVAPTPAQLDAIDYLHAARWLPAHALHPRILAALCADGYATVADGYIRLTDQGWDLYTDTEVGA